MSCAWCPSCRPGDPACCWQRCPASSQGSCCLRQPCPRPAHVQGSIGSKRTHSDTLAPHSTPDAGPPLFSPAAAGGARSTTAAAQPPTPHQPELSSTHLPSVMPTSAASVEQAGQAETPVPAKMDPFSLLPSDSDVSHLLSLRLRSTLGDPSLCLVRICGEADHDQRNSSRCAACCTGVERRRQCQQGSILPVFTAAARADCRLS